MIIPNDNPPDRIELRSRDPLLPGQQPEDVPRRPTVKVVIDPYTGEFKSRLVADPAVLDLAAEGRGDFAVEKKASSSPKGGTADPAARGGWMPTAAHAGRRGLRHAR